MRRAAERASQFLLRTAWFWLVVIFFVAVCLSSLTFVYVDTDDAASIAYHALGRNPEIQPPFEDFQFGVDYIFTCLPPDESTLRMAAMVLSAAAAAGIFILLLALAFELVGFINPMDRLAMALFLLLACPEFTYLGLLYTPMLVGVCAILSAHLMLRISLRNTLHLHVHGPRFWGLVVISAFLMALGGFCRWDLILYALVILCDISCNADIAPRNAKMVHSRLTRLVLVWVGVAMVFWWCLVLISGDFSRAIHTTAGAVTETSKEVSSERELLKALGAHSMLITPAFATACIIGLLTFWRTRRSHAWMVLGLVLAVVLWPFRSSPKEYLVFLPLIVVTALLGFRQIWSRGPDQRLSSYRRIGFAVLLVIPWVVGVRMGHADSPWGPGFSLHRVEGEPGNNRSGFPLGLFSGDAFPTTEGPRPLMGHFYVLFGGEWRTLVSTLSDERIAAERRAIKEKLPLLILGPSEGFQLAELAGQGFSTSEPQPLKVVNAPEIRKFINPDGRQVALVRFELRPLLNDKRIGQSIMQRFSVEKVVVWTDPTTMRLLHHAARGGIESLGPYTAIVDLDSLYAKLPEGEKQ